MEPGHLSRQQTKRLLDVGALTDQGRKAQLVRHAPHHQHRFAGHAAGAGEGGQIEIHIGL